VLTVAEWFLHELDRAALQLIVKFAVTHVRRVMGVIDCRHVIIGGVMTGVSFFGDGREVSQQAVKVVPP
jgi:hypothetical protein